MRLMSFDYITLSYDYTACSAYTMEIYSLCCEILPSTKIVFLFIPKRKWQEKFVEMVQKICG